MPLPENNPAWPPKPFDIAQNQMRVWDAWYVGDPGELAGIYSSGSMRTATRPSQYQGGVVGAAARFFWGRPRSPESDRTRLHVPVAADLATTNADLLFSEPPRLVLPGDAEDRGRKPRQARLEAMFNTPEVHAALLEASEVSAALGGVYLRANWDTEVFDEVQLDTVHADAAIPEWQWGRLVAVTFWTQLENSRDDQRVYRHLERHEPGRILHGLYVGDTTHLGRAHPLAEHPATEWAARLVDADGAILTRVEGLTAAYVPNMRPSRKWRQSSLLAPLGRSDYDGVEPLLDAFDEAYSSWMRDVRLAKARILVGAGYLRNDGPGRGASFDTEQEIFTELNIPGSGTSAPVLSPQQFAIRVDEHRATTVDLLRGILRAAGYSPSTFGDDPLAISTTATEVKARERMSERTRDKKARYWAAALAPLAATMMDLDRAVYKRQDADRQGLVPEVRFPPKPQQDLEEQARTIQALHSAEAASTETKVRMAHPEWDGDTVNAEVEKIHQEVGRGLPDPFQAEVP